MDTGQSKAERRSVRQLIDGWFHTLHWLITAFAAVLVFLVFEMQAYTIPTGSMAETLRGAHFRLRCEQCGYRYDYDFPADLYRLPRNRSPRQDLPLTVPLYEKRRMPDGREEVRTYRTAAPRCPSCGFSHDTAAPVPVVSGDRIFVFKSIYQFMEPRRWDVVVFKNPTQPQINYIKRMIALPGEELEIYDGDIYINGEIARKPRRVQEELWLTVYDNNYHPVNPNALGFEHGSWHPPFVNAADSQWDLSAQGDTVFSLDSDDGSIHTLRYDSSRGNDFQAIHTFDRVDYQQNAPLCSDLMVRFDVDTGGPSGRVGAGVSKYGILYTGIVSWGPEGVLLQIERHPDGGVEELVSARFAGALDEVNLLRFCNVDHQLVLEFGEHEVRYDLGRGKEDAGSRRSIMPEVEILGSGTLTILNIAVYRDLHYLSANMEGRILQGTEGKTFTLGADEYFVLGDNTPASSDSRMWARPGQGNTEKEYRQGTVPRDYLVGKAFVVYWPGANKPFSRFKLVPYVSGMKLIAGGSKNLF